MGYIEDESGMRNRLSSLIRKFGPCRAQKGKQELVFKCPSCGRWKLSYNSEKDVFHPCFRCNFAVKLWRTAKKVIRFLDPEEVVAEDLPIVPPGPIYALGRKEGEFLAGRGIRITPPGWGVCDKLPGRRIWIPIVENSETMCYVARAINGEKPKELSGPNRSHFFYGYDYKRLVDSPSIILVEGIFDQIHVQSFGHEYRCLALMGSSISDIQIGKLLALKAGKIILMMDGDEAGRKATRAIANKLSSRMSCLNIQEIYLPEGKDPDDLSLDDFHNLGLQ